MEIVWVLALVLALFPAGVLRAIGWLRWPRRRETRLAAWHLRVVGIAVLVVAVAVALLG